MIIDAQAVMIIKVVGIYALGLLALSLVCGILVNIIFRKMNVR